MDKQEFFEKVKSYADERHMTCELKDNWFDKADWSVFVKKDVSLNGHPKGLHTEAVHVKKLKNGLYRFWLHSIYPSGRQDIAGRGYASGAYNDASLEKICKWFVTSLDWSI